MLNILLCLALITSCSFKKEEKKDRSSKDQLRTDITQDTTDSDGDGVTDQDELKASTDPFIADVPTFQGEFFKELKVNIELYNKISKGYENIKWVIKDGKTKLSWEAEEMPSPHGSLYMETLLKNYATNVSFKKNNFRFFDYNEGIFSYSSPNLFEDTLFSISNQLIGLSRQGYQINRAEAVILSKFQITSKKYQSFRNPVFDIYYKSKNREGLIFIESKRIDGTYSFNEDNDVYIHFESTDPQIINEALLSGGASFFLKLRDFVIYDTGETYSSILEKVQSKSVPVTIAYTQQGEAEKTTVETIYVGINGEPKRLKEILKISLKDEVLMTDLSIDQVRGLSNRIRSYGESGQNETLKWFVGASDIEDNVYSHKFNPNQGIGLAYISDKKIEKKPIFVSRSTLSNGLSSTSGKLPSETKGLKIKITPQRLLEPFEKTTRVTLPNCGHGNWDVNQIHYNQINLAWAKKEDQLRSHLLKDGFIKIHTGRGSLIEDNIGKLTREGFLTVTDLNPGDNIEIALSNKIAEELSRERTQVSVDIHLRPTSVVINDGAMTQVGGTCTRLDSDRPHGIEGGPRGGGSGMTDGYEKKVSESGMGFQVGREEVQYDLDIHVFAY